MATTITKIIDPDNGSGTDFTSLSAWEAAMQKDLVAADETKLPKKMRQGRKLRYFLTCRKI